MRLVIQTFVDEIRSTFQVDDNKFLTLPTDEAIANNEIMAKLSDADKSTLELAINPLKNLAKPLTQ